MCACITYAYIYCVVYHMHWIVNADCDFTELIDYLNAYGSFKTNRAKIDATDDWIAILLINYACSSASDALSHLTGDVILFYFQFLRIHMNMANEQNKTTFVNCLRYGYTAD